MPRNNAPAPLLFGDLVRLTIFYTSQAQVLETVLDYEADTLNIVGQPELTAFINAWQAANEANLLNCIPPTCVLNGYAAAVLSNNLIAGITKNRNVVGGAGVNSLPIEMAAVARKYTGLKGQHGRGRVFWPCVPNTFTTPVTEPNQLNGTGTAAYGIMHISLQAVVSAAPRFYAPVVSTRPIPPATVITRASPNPVFQIQTLLGTQRRRREGRGK
jgi:hypothetical protein